jgi:hypothetical protein
MVNPIHICPQQPLFEKSKCETRFPFVPNGYSLRSQNCVGFFLFFCFPCCDIATLAIILQEHLAKFGYGSHISEESRKILESC